MEIVLSVNNRKNAGDVMVLPVTPASFTVSKPQSLEEFEVMSKKDLQLIGVPKLKGLVFDSFFPIAGHDYHYLKNREMWGWEYVERLDNWIAEKYPIRVVITETPINMASAVADFQYTIKSDGDLWYSLSFKEFNLLEETLSNNGEEELTVAQYDELKQSLDYISALVTQLANPMIYNYIDENMPEWARVSVQKAVDKGILSGTGDGLGLTDTDLKTIVWLDRLGLFD